MGICGLFLVVRIVMNIAMAFAFIIGSIFSGKYAFNMDGRGIFVAGFLGVFICRD